MLSAAAAYSLEESKDDKRQKRTKSKKPRATKKEQAGLVLAKSRKRSQTLSVVSHIKIDVPGRPSYMQKVVKKLRLREMSERKFCKWVQKKSGHQSANVMGIVDEISDEADSWQ